MVQEGFAGSGMAAMVDLARVTKAAVSRLDALDGELRLNLAGRVDDVRKELLQTVGGRVESLLLATEAAASRASILDTELRADVAAKIEAVEGELVRFAEATALSAAPVASAAEAAQE